MAKKALVAAVLVGMMLIAMTGTALAKDPTGNSAPFTFTENAPENGNIPAPGNGPAGASAWTYRDAYDGGVYKTEGSYRSFDSTAGAGSYSVNPHGGYSTTSNKCKTCHAVHRASGSFALLRVDNPDDSCNYCHIGSHRHASSEAYFGGSNGIYSSNGHTIGSGKEIPDSSVWQWTENVTLSGDDGASATFGVRRYLSQKNKIMKYVVHGNRFIRVGPNYLRCASCHQVHNASRQIWQPVWSGFGPNGGAAAAGDKMVNGYKLLRNGPSGGIAVNDTPGTGDVNADGTLDTASPGPRAASRLNFTYYDPGVSGQLDGLAASSADYRIKAVETTNGIVPSTGLEANTGATIMGANKTGYTAWKYTAGSNLPSEVVTAMKIQETSLAFWCSDCHNLNIAGKTLTPGFGTGRTGDGMLGDRSHAVPSQVADRGANGTMAAGAQCYMCHNNDMPLDRTAGDPCGACHIGPRLYHYYKNGATNANGQTWEERRTALGTAYNANTYASRSDFPHSGPDSSMKLLNARDRIAADTAADNNNVTNPGDIQGTAFNKATDGIDKVCKECHGGYKKREIGVDK